MPISCSNNTILLIPDLCLGFSEDTAVEDFILIVIADDQDLVTLRADVAYKLKKQAAIRVKHLRGIDEHTLVLTWGIPGVIAHKIVMALAPPTGTTQTH